MPWLVLLSAARAWRTGVNPAASCVDEFSMRKRRRRAHRSVRPAARTPRPKHQRRFLVMLKQRASIHIFIPRSIRHSSAHGRTRQRAIAWVLPSHRQRRQVPIWSAGYAGTLGVLFLMATHAIQRGHATVCRPADDIREMPMPVIALLRIICGRMTVDAAR